MDYQRIYDEFIQDRLSKPVPNGYSEKHHIIPKSIGGSNGKENIVRLTPEDHVFAHKLLALIHKNRGMWFALLTMLSENGLSARGYKGSRKDYGIARRKYAETLSVDHPLRGRKLTPDHIQKIKDNTVIRAGEDHPFFGRKHSTETREKMSNSNKTPTGQNHPMFGRKQSLKFVADLKETQSGIGNRNSDKSLHKFIKEDSIFIGTRVEFSNKSGLKSYQISRLVNGHILKSKGWEYAGTA